MSAHRERREGGGEGGAEGQRRVAQVQVPVVEAAGEAEHLPALRAPAQKKASLDAQHHPPTRLPLESLGLPQTVAVVAVGAAGELGRDLRAALRGLSLSRQPLGTQKPASNTLTLVSLRQRGQGMRVFAARMLTRQPWQNACPQPSTRSSRQGTRHTWTK